ncbi:MAG: hypothetical protein R3E10_03670 [Gemmatimonadota bacterium]
MRTKVLIAYLIALTLATIWPGAALANRVRPFIFGLPFNFAWYAFWILLGFVLFLWLDAEQQRRERGQ